MKAQDIQIGDRLRFDEYGEGVHTGIVFAIAGEGGSATVKLNEISPSLRSGALTIEKMAAFLYPADAPTGFVRDDQRSIRGYINTNSAERK